jgi:multidrug efflux pump subunit AcrA (membrane-fusion protein)
LRPRTRPAGKSKKTEAKRIKKAQEGANKGQAQGSLPFEDMQAFQIEAQRAAQAQAMQEAQAAAEAMSQQWVAQQAAAQAEAAAAQAAARQASTQALLSFMAQSQAKDLATMGASALDDTPLMHSGVSSMSSGTLKGVLHEPTYEMAFLYEFQYASMAESASQVEPRAATAKTDMLAAAEKEKKKEGGCIGRGVRIRGSTASGYSFYDMTQMAGGAPTGQKIARTGTVQALLP